MSKKYWVKSDDQEKLCLYCTATLWSNLQNCKNSSKAESLNLNGVNNRPGYCLLDMHLRGSNKDGKGGLSLQK